MQVRKDNFATNATPYALAHRMAGELGQALFGLNTWGDDELADQCREVHRIAMNFLETDIKYAQNFGQERECGMMLLKSLREGALAWLAFLLVLEIV